MRRFFANLIEFVILSLAVCAGVLLAGWLIAEVL